MNNPIATKDGVKIVLKNDIADEVEKITETNSRSQINGKKTMLDVYKCVARVFAPLLKSDNEQGKLETQESDDKQPDITDTSDLESRKSAAPEEQSAKALKILTPNQMLCRLSISLAQVKAGNNSEKLKNKIRQLLCSLCRSK